MGDYERILAAYMFLCALEQCGVHCESVSIHEMWLKYCRREDPYAQNEILNAAMSQRFQL